MNFESKYSQHEEFKQFFFAVIKIIMVEGFRLNNAIDQSLLSLFLLLLCRQFCPAETKAVISTTIPLDKIFGFL